MAEVYPIGLPQSSGSQNYFPQKRQNNLNLSGLSQLIQLKRQQKQDEMQDKRFMLETLKSSIDLLKDVPHLAHRSEAFNKIASEYTLDKPLSEVKDAMSSLDTYKNALNFLRDPRIKLFTQEADHYNKKIVPVLDKLLDPKTQAVMLESMGKDNLVKFLGDIEKNRTPVYDDKGFPINSMLDINGEKYIDFNNLTNIAERNALIAKEERDAAGRARVIQKEKDDITINTVIPYIKKRNDEAKLEYEQQVKELENDYDIPPETKSLIKSIISNTYERKIEYSKDKPLDISLEQRAVTKFMEQRGNGGNKTFEEILRELEIDDKTKYYQTNKNVDVNTTYHGLPQGGGKNGGNSSSSTSSDSSSSYSDEPYEAQSIVIPEIKEDGTSKDVSYDMNKREDVLKVIGKKTTSTGDGVILRLPNGAVLNSKDLGIFDITPDVIHSVGKKRPRYYVNNSVYSDSDFAKGLEAAKITFWDNGVLKYTASNEAVPLDSDGKYTFQLEFDIPHMYNYDKNLLDAKRYDYENDLIYFKKNNKHLLTPKDFPGVVSNTTGNVNPNVQPQTQPQQQSQVPVQTDTNSQVDTTVRKGSTNGMSTIIPLVKSDYSRAPAGQTKVYTFKQKEGNQINYGQQPSSDNPVGRIVDISTEYIKAKNLKTPINPKVVVMHRMDGNLNMTDPIRSFKEDSSAHAVIKDDGEVVILVPKNIRANHTAAVTEDEEKKWNPYLNMGLNTVNANSLGIEFEGFGPKPNDMTIKDDQIIGFWRYLENQSLSDIALEKLTSHSDFEPDNPDIQKHEKERIHMFIDRVRKLETPFFKPNLKDILADINSEIIKKYPGLNIGAGIQFNK